MTFVTARDLRLHPARVWETLGKAHEVVVTLKGRPIGVLAKASGDDLEEILRSFRQARAGYAISRLREEAAAAGANRMGMAEIEREITAVRRSRSAGAPGEASAGRSRKARS